MNRRPKIWIHRTGRFWWGLAILLVLQGAWIFTMLQLAGVYFNRGYNDYGRGLVKQGGLEISVTYTGLAAPSSPYSWKFVRGREFGVRMGPEFSWRKSTILPLGMGVSTPGDMIEVNLFLPGWIPILIWIPWWLLRMRRGDKLEDAIAGQALLPEGPDRDPA